MAKTVTAPKGPGQQLGSQDGPFRKGQWVLVGPEEKIGIHVASAGLGVAEVHMVNDKGETTLVSPRHSTKELKPAALKHIPKARRPDDHPRYPKH